MDFKPRLVQEKIVQAADFFKIVLVVGARQVGKSTLLNKLFPEAKSFVFDPVQDLFGARKDPDLFLASYPAPLILDEIQFTPELLPALKRFVDRTSPAGQYFLTGSQNLSMLRSVAESMAGRVAIISLEHFTLQEALGFGEKQSWLPRYLDDPSNFYLQGASASASKPLIEVLWRGMFPGALTLPNDQIPLFFRSYIQTYVERDIRLLAAIQDIATFDRFIGLLAALTAQEINFSQLGREVGVSPQTAQRWLDMLMQTYQWANIPPYHGNTIKRLSGRPKGVMKDSGMVCYLQRMPSPESLAVSPQLGRIFESWVINLIQQYSSAMSMPPQLYHWRTEHGAEVDLVLEWGGNLYPIEVKCKSVVSKGDASGIQAFRATYDKNKIMPGLVVYAGTTCYKIDEHTLALPWNFMSML